MTNAVWILFLFFSTVYAIAADEKLPPPAGGETADFATPPNICSEEVAGGATRSFSSFDATADGIGGVSLPQSEPMIGKVLAERYEVIRRIGRGGQGEVFVARDLVLKREIVIKLIFTNDQPALLGEAEALAKVTHPNVNHVNNFGVTQEGWPFVDLELLRGENLEDWRSDQSVIEFVKIIIQISEGISAVHAVGLLHRDLKPSNILITPNKVAKVIDFGLAVSQTEIDPTKISGTPAYMAPEQLNYGSPLDTRTDVFALGAVLYFALTGQPPYVGKSVTAVVEKARARNFDAAMLRRLRDSKASKELQLIALKAMSKDPAERFQSAAEFASALNRTLPNPNVVRRALAGALVSVPLIIGSWWYSTSDPRPVSARGLAKVSLETAQLVKFKIWLVKGTGPNRQQFDVAKHLPLKAGDKISVDVSVPKGHYPVLIWAWAGDFKILAMEREPKSNLDVESYERFAFPGQQETYDIEKLRPGTDLMVAIVLPNGTAPPTHREMAGLLPDLQRLGSLSGGLGFRTEGLGILASRPLNAERDMGARRDIQGTIVSEDGRRRALLEKLTGLNNLYPMMAGDALPVVPNPNR